MRVREHELVQMVDVGDAEVEGGDEHDLAGGSAGEDVQGDEEGAEEDFFGQGPDEVGSQAEEAGPGE